MSETQFPRFMVFQRSGADEPMVHNGSVHAPDIEMALLNARDVFVRRPEAQELWVVPAEQILSRTREELAGTLVIARSTGAAQPILADEAISPTDLKTFCVFGKLSEPTQAEQLGEVQAADAAAALTLALEKFSDKTVLRWYVFPASVVVKSDAADADPMFAPARDKTFKDQAQYPVVTMMRQIRAKGRLEE